MLEITNTKIYDLKETVISCRNAMRLEPAEYTDEEFENSLPRAIQLASNKDGSGHKNFLKGIRVSFDLKYTQYITKQLQRYGFFDYISSSSLMHKITKMDFDKCCNKYVTQQSIKQMKELIEVYNQNPSYENYMFIISNCPMGTELFVRVSTNYMQLKTIYTQRKSHKLKEDYKALCDWISTLPYSKEFLTIKTNKHNEISRVQNQQLHTPQQ